MIVDTWGTYLSGGENWAFPLALALSRELS